MKTTRLMYGIAILLLPLIACKKLKDSKLPKDCAKCINKEINNIKSKKVSNPAGSIWQYDYNGETVFYIPARCCDIPSRLMDNNCNFICSPDGGITGKGDGNCTDFFGKRTNEKLIWQDDRK
jgi:hypothetical protein